MSIIEIIILIIGAILVIAGYSYSKISESKKEKQATKGYKEYIRICKKHEEKNGKFLEVFEIIVNGKTIEYKFPPQESKDGLRKIDSIEKFYINESSSSNAPKTLSDITKSSEINKKTLHLCYALMGAGLVIILIILIRIIL